ncbi:MAG: 16S rRNA (uracil(1498)-N(3))-methyltransferase [Holophagales bacterium]|nr:16S rRNA (uracil(1498)-N(3))-methyltransferase [Holophagales bacterium]
MRDDSWPSVTFLAPRLEAGGTTWAEGGEIRVEGDTYRHLFRSRRLAVGDTLRVVDGEGGARRASVASVDRRSARLVLGDVLPARDPELRLHLVVGALRPERASWLVEKATELGVRSLTFVTAERAPRDYGAGRIDRFRRVSVAALEQSHRARLPEIRGVIPWRQALTDLPPGRCFVPSPGAHPLLRAVAKNPGDTETSGLGEPSLVIGPEGGWSPGELGQLRAAGGEPVGLGEGVLRVETAAIVAAAVLLCSAMPGSPSRGPC